MEKTRDWWKVRGGGRGNSSYLRNAVLAFISLPPFYVVFYDSQEPGLSGFRRRRDSLTFPLPIGQELRLQFRSLTGRPRRLEGEVYRADWLRGAGRV